MKRKERGNKQITSKGYQRYILCISIYIYMYYIYIYVLYIYIYVCKGFGSQLAHVFLNLRGSLAVTRPPGNSFCHLPFVVRCPSTSHPFADLVCPGNWVRGWHRALLGSCAGPCNTSSEVPASYKTPGFFAVHGTFPLAAFDPHLLPGACF